MVLLAYAAVRRPKNTAGEVLAMGKEMPNGNL